LIIVVTHHAAERYRQRVRGSLEEQAEVAGRVASAYAAGRVEPGQRGTILVRDVRDRDLVFLCRPDGDELIVISLWQEGDEAQVPRSFTDALRKDDHRV
jgi:hypothetical protein